jgi:hypothetical protein
VNPEVAEAGGVVGLWHDRAMPDLATVGRGLTTARPTA